MLTCEEVVLSDPGKPPCRLGDRLSNVRLSQGLGLHQADAHKTFIHRAPKPGPGAAAQMGDNWVFHALRH